MFFLGTFNPFHLGHQFVVDFALRNGNEVIILLCINNKKNKISQAKKQKILNEIKQIYKDNKKVVVLINPYYYLNDFLNEINCFNLIRGIRNINDFYYEQRLYLSYLKQNKKIKIFYVPSHKKLKTLSSSNLRKNIF